VPRSAVAPLGLTTEGGTKFKLKGWKCYPKKLQCRGNWSEVGTRTRKKPWYCLGKWYPYGNEDFMKINSEAKEVPSPSRSNVSLTSDEFTCSDSWCRDALGTAFDVCWGQRMHRCNSAFVEENPHWYKCNPNQLTSEIFRMSSCSRGRSQNSECRQVTTRNLCPFLEATLFVWKMKKHRTKSVPARLETLVLVLFVKWYWTSFEVILILRITKQTWTQAWIRMKH